jgi:large subunit ribosomal protein L25
LKLDGTKHNVLVRRVDRKGGAGPVQHVDFYAVDLKQKVTVDVPLHFEGEAPAVRDLGATVPYALTSVSVECLPGDIPQSIVVDLSSLARLEDVIFVRDLAVPDNVRVLTDGDLPVASPVQTSAAVAVAAAEAGEEAPAEEPAAPATEE